MQLALRANLSRKSCDSKMSACLVGLPRSLYLVIAWTSPIIGAAVLRDNACEAGVHTRSSRRHRPSPSGARESGHGAERLLAEPRVSRCSTSGLLTDGVAPSA